MFEKVIFLVLTLGNVVYAAERNSLYGKQGPEVISQLVAQQTLSLDVLKKIFNDQEEKRTPQEGTSLFQSALNIAYQTPIAQWSSIFAIDFNTYSTDTLIKFIQERDELNHSYVTEFYWMITPDISSMKYEDLPITLTRLFKNYIESKLQNRFTPEKSVHEDLYYTYRVPTEHFISYKSDAVRRLYNARQAFLAYSILSDYLEQLRQLSPDKEIPWYQAGLTPLLNFTKNLGDNRPGMSDVDRALENIQQSVANPTLSSPKDKIG